jgi:general secretion pathway protein D
LLNRYAMIPKGDDTMMLIHHSGSKSPTPEGLPVFSAIRDLPLDEQIVHFVLPLEHLSAEEASKAFQEVIKLHTYGSIAAMPNSSALIITENTATIRSIYEIAQVIDVPPADVANELITLERSDAERIADIINEIYSEPDKEVVAPAGSAAAAPPSVPAPGQAPSAAAVNPAGSTNTANTNPTAARVRVFADRRTNSLLVIARPVDIAHIRSLVDKLDRQSDGLTFMKRKLNFLSVGDFLPVAYNALARDTDIPSDGASVTGGPARRSPPRLRGGNSTPSTIANRGEDGFGMAGGGFAGGLGGGTGFGGGSNRSLLDDPEQQAAPQAMVVGRTLLIADAQSNSLVVSGSPEHIQVIDQLIQEIDVRPQQIYISTVIGQLNLGGDINVGFDFLRLLDDVSMQQRITNTTSNSQSNTACSFQTESSNGRVTQDLKSFSGDRSASSFSETGLGEPGTMLLPFNGQNFNWNSLNLCGQLGSLSRYVNLLEAERNFRVLSRPSVYTTNNGKAVISSGQRIAVPTQILSNAGSVVGVAAANATIDYRDVVLKLEVIPLINSDDEVTLRIAQINDNIVGEQVIAGNTVPTISTQELVTTVTVRNGGTVVLGGLITERVSESARGTIFLRRIPVIKHLFGVTNRAQVRDELLIFIQPSIITQRAEQAGAPNVLERGRSQIMDEAAHFGMPDTIQAREVRWAR